MPTSPAGRGSTSPPPSPGAPSAGGWRRPWRNTAPAGWSSCLRRAREDFYLPAAKGVGHPISQGELERLRRQLEPSVFFSPDLCARYFTYMSRETGAHFVLFDDGETLAKKRALALELGITRFFLLYPEVEEWLPQLLGT